MTRTGLLTPAVAASLLPPAVSAAGPPKGTRRAMVVCGLPGDDEHGKLYAGAVEKIVTALTQRYGFPADQIFVRFGVPVGDDDGPALKGARGLSDRAGIEADVAEMRK